MEKTDKKKPVTVLLEDDLLGLLENDAARQGLSKSSLIRMLLLKHYEKDGTE